MTINFIDLIDIEITFNKIKTKKKQGWSLVSDIHYVIPDEFVLKNTFSRNICKRVYYYFKSRPNPFDIRRLDNHLQLIFTKLTDLGSSKNLGKDCLKHILPVSFRADIIDIYRESFIEQLEEEHAHKIKKEYAIIQEKERKQEQEKRQKRFENYIEKHKQDRIMFIVSEGYARFNSDDGFELIEGKLLSLPIEKSAKVFADFVESNYAVRIYDNDNEFGLKEIAFLDEEDFYDY